MKKIAILFIMIALISMTCLTACVGDSTNTFNTSAQAAIVNENADGVKIHDDIAAKDIRYVNINGNAKSIVIRQGTNNYFQFHNADLIADHKYEVRCDENGDTLDISIMMENAEADNNFLGSIVIDIPQKEFEIIETTGDFRQIYCYTINSDVLIQANKADTVVNLDLESEHLNHNITLDGLESNTFRGVLVFLDEVPDNVKMELNLIQGGTIIDSQSILENNRLETGSGKPVISINNAKEIDVYCKE